MAADDDENKKADMKEEMEEDANKESSDPDLGCVVMKGDATTAMSVRPGNCNDEKEKDGKEESSVSDLGCVVIYRVEPTQNTGICDNCKEKDLEKESVEKEENTGDKEDVEENTGDKEDVEENTGDKEDVEENTHDKEDVEENTHDKEDVEEDTDDKEDVEEESQSSPSVTWVKDIYQNFSRMPSHFWGYKLRDILRDLANIKRDLHIVTKRDKLVCPCNFEKAPQVHKMLQDVSKRLDDMVTLPQYSKTKTEKWIVYAIRLANARISAAVVLLERTLPGRRPKPTSLVASTIALILKKLGMAQKTPYPNGSVVVSNVEETSRALREGFRPTFRQCVCDDPLNLVAITAYVNFAYSSLRVTRYLALINFITTGGTMGDMNINGWMCTLDKPKTNKSFYVCPCYHLSVFQGCNPTWQNKQFSIKDSLDRTALHLAVLLDRAHLLPVLLRKGISPNTTDVGTNTPLLTAVVVKDMTQVKTLMSFGADLYKKNRYGITALHLAISMDDMDLLNFLLADPKPHPPFSHLED